ncbi:MAG: response regulator [Deltaproteobacteria bacterium]|nr:response regulator [Deltaproteobacteria bacterium]
MKRFTYSLKAILLFSFVFVGGLPILVMGFIAGRIISADVAQSVRTKNLLIAQSLSAEVDSFLQNSFSFLRQIEETVIEKRYPKEDDITVYLGSMMKTIKEFESVEILDEEGIVRFMFPPDPNVIGINCSGQTFYSQAKRQNQPYWSPTFISMLTGKPTLTLAFPVKGGMIVGSLDLASLNAVTDKISAGRQGCALIVDQEGTVIAHPDRQKISERYNLKHLLSSGRKNQLMEGNLSYREDGRDYLASLSRVPHTRWMVVITVPADEAFEPVARIRALFGTGTVVIVLMAVIIVFLSLRRVSAPLSRLVHDTRRIADGQYTLEERPPSYKEINDLVDHFRRMAGVLRSREDALRQLSARNAAILDSVPDMIMEMDIHKTYTWANQAGLRFFGEDVIGREASISLQGEQNTYDMVNPMFNDSDQVIRLDSWQRRQDGEKRLLSWRFKVLKNEQGHVTGSLSTARDITELKRAEDERMNLERQLQQAQKAESLGRMAGSIAHHFNNMLGVVMGNLELALYDLPQESDVRAYLVKSIKASHKAAEISHLMLAYLGQTTGRKEPLDLVEAVRETLPLLSASIPGKVYLKTEIPPAGPIILGDSVHIKQILSNLVTNALEAIGEGEGEIVLALRIVGKAETRELRLFPLDWDLNREDYVCLSVSDTGCGMDAATQEKIFDPFFSTKFTGRGLGLSVVLGLVRAQDGAIAIDSRPGCGAVFRVFFPIHTQEALPSPKEEPIVSKAVEAGGLILVVDDEPMVRNTAQSILERLLGYKVVTAGDGYEAVEIFRVRKHEFNLVLLDLTMPGMNGWETLSALRAVRTDIPVILASGYDEAQVMQEEHPEWPQAFLHKPYGLSDLKAAFAATEKPVHSTGKGIQSK